MKETTLSGASADTLAENMAKLQQLFPEVFVEGRIDFDKLRAVLGENIEGQQERYNFTWWGKSRALRLAQTPSMGTLRPCKEESKDWDTTGNLYIEGDNLEVLKLLQKSYHNRVKMIYIDPPYNTGNDFVYKDDYKDPLQNYLQLTNQVDEEGHKLGTNSEASGRYHTNWLNMMYPRLRLARNLLREDGVIFISIDDNEVANLRKICDEIFGEENFIANVIWEKKYSPQNDSTWFSDNHDHILIFAKNKSIWRPNLLPRKKEQNDRYKNKDNDPRGPWKATDFSVKTYSANYDYEIITPSGKTINPPKSRSWVTSEENFKKLLSDNRIWFGENGDNVPSLKKFLSEVRDGIVPQTIWKYSEVGHNQDAAKELRNLFNGEAYFETPKPEKLLRRITRIGSDSENDLVLDFFSGVSTTAHAVMQLNAEDGGQRKFILVQLPETTAQDSEAHKAGYVNICEIGKERIRRAGEKIKAELIEEQKGQPSLLEGDKRVDPEGLDIGFKVFKLDSSNLKKWNPDTKDLEASLLDAVENFVDGRSELDLVYEILLKYGVDLSLPIEEFGAGDSKIYSVGGGALLLCLGNKIDAQVAEELVRLKEKLNPEITRVVFRDNGFTDDSAKTNAKELLRNAGVDEIVSI